MEIKKGNFYYNNESNQLIIADKDMVVLDNLFTNKIAVHTPTQEDWDFVVGKVREKYYNFWSRKGIDTHIDLSDGCHSNGEWYQENNYHIITIDQFRDLFKDEVNKKVYIRGHETRGAEVLAKLESLGGVNKWGYYGFYDSRYYLLCKEGSITYSTNPPQDHTDIFLDEQKITKEQVELKVVDYAISVNWDFDKVFSFVNSINNIPKTEWLILKGIRSNEKVKNIFAKYYDNSPLMQGVKHLPKIDKPEHYAKGIDTFARMEANCSVEECISFAKGNIDKYNWRKKGQDIEDFDKIIAYANWAKKLLSK